MEVFTIIQVGFPGLINYSFTVCISAHSESPRV